MDYCPEIAKAEYDTFLVRLCLHRRHIYANTARRSRKKHVGRSAVFDKQVLKKTSYTMERFFS